MVGCVGSMAEPGLASLPKPDCASREFGHLKIRLRNDLHFSSGRHGRHKCYIVEDKLRSKFFRIGVPEYQFISLLDGSRSVEKALAINSRSAVQDALDERDAAVIVKWLLDTGLARPESGVQAEDLSAAVSQSRSAKTMRRLNLLFIKIPLLNPDRLLGAVLPVCRWMLTPAFFAVWMLAVVSGAYQVSVNWPRFVADSSQFFAINNWIWLLAVWIILKCVHELFHGLVCKKYGGNVWEAGVIMVLFAPIGYVDATSSWRFASKWQRIFTAGAGMYVELMIAGGAAWIWASTDTGITNHLAHNVIIIASISTLLFNANPLMKFDGYYMLADWLEIPNFYGEGQLYTKYLGRKYFLGLSAKLPPWSRRDRWLVRAYGVAAFLWRILVIATLLLLASTLFDGAGLIIAAVSAAVLLGQPLIRFMRYLWHGNDFEKPSLARFALSAAVVGLVLFALFTHITWSRALTSPGVVEYVDVMPLRADVGGFISLVNAYDGQRVQEGDHLLSLVNKELETQLRDVTLQLEQLKLKKRLFVLKRQIAQAQAQDEQIDALREQYAELNTRLDRLIVTAPVGGEIIGADLSNRLGQYVTRGELLLTIAPSPEKEFKVLIAQEDIEEFRGRVGDRVAVLIDGRNGDAVPGTLMSIEPRAATTIDFPELTALGGGPLPIVGGRDGRSAVSVLAQPHFTGTVRLNERARRWYVGESGELSARGRARPIGTIWYESVQNWIRDTIEFAKQANLDV